jgi:hypothetical protein
MAERAHIFCIRFHMHTRHQVSVFETTIRTLGGLLSAHALTGDKLYLTRFANLLLHPRSATYICFFMRLYKLIRVHNFPRTHTSFRAVDVGKRLLPAFRSGALPCSTVRS